MKIKTNFAVISDKDIFLYDKNHGGGHTICSSNFLENVSLQLIDSVLTIKGSQTMYDFNIPMLGSEISVDDVEEDDLVEERHWWTLWKKTTEVKDGWVAYKKREPITLHMTDFKIIDMRVREE